MKSSITLCALLVFSGITSAQDSLAEQIEKMRTLNTQVVARLSTVESKVDALTAKVDAIAAKLDGKKSAAINCDCPTTGVCTCIPGTCNCGAAKPTPFATQAAPVQQYRTVQICDGVSCRTVQVPVVANSATTATYTYADYASDDASASASNGRNGPIRRFLARLRSRRGGGSGGCASCGQ